MIIYIKLKSTSKTDNLLLFNSFTDGSKKLLKIIFSKLSKFNHANNNVKHVYINYIPVVLEVLCVLEKPRRVNQFKTTDETLIIRIIISIHRYTRVIHVDFFKIIGGFSEMFHQISIPIQKI
jgi:hypothetical protein